MINLNFTNDSFHSKVDLGEFDYVCDDEEIASTFNNSNGFFLTLYIVKVVHLQSILHWLSLR